jgi:PAS domain S-box-containing protein
MTARPLHSFLRTVPVDSDIASLVLEGVAMAVFSLDGRTFLWGTPAAYTLFGFDPWQGAPRPTNEGPFRHRLSTLGAGEAPTEGFQIERLRLPGQRFGTVTMGFRLIALPGGMSAILAIAENLAGPQGELATHIFSPAGPAISYPFDPAHLWSEASTAAEPDQEVEEAKPEPSGFHLDLRDVMARAAQERALAAKVESAPVSETGTDRGQSSEDASPFWLSDDLDKAADGPQHDPMEDAVSAHAEDEPPSSEPDEHAAAQISLPWNEDQASSEAMEHQPASETDDHGPPVAVAAHLPDQPSTLAVSEEIDGTAEADSAEPTSDPAIGPAEPAEPAALQTGTEPAPEATDPTAEATEPAPEATNPAAEATEPAPEATEPPAEATDPAETEATDGENTPIDAEADPVDIASEAAAPTVVETVLSDNALTVMDAPALDGDILPPDTMAVERISTMDATDVVEPEAVGADEPALLMAPQAMVGAEPMPTPDQPEFNQPEPGFDPEPTTREYAPAEPLRVADTLEPVPVLEPEPDETAQTAERIDETRPETLPPAEIAVAEVSAPAPVIRAIGRRKTRFKWQTDADGRFARLADEIHARLSPASDGLLGHKLAELDDVLFRDESGEVVAAFAWRNTFTNVETLWRGKDDVWYVVLLSGAPLYRSNGAFDGFRGFGVISAEDEEPEAVSPPPSDPPASVAEISKPSEAEPALTEAEVQPVLHQEAPPSDEPGGGGDGQSPSEVEVPQVEPPAADHVEAPQVEPARVEAVQVEAVQVEAPAADHVAPPVVELSPPPTSAPEPPAPQSAEIDDLRRLSAKERLAFREIARALGARIEDLIPPPPVTAAAPQPADQPRDTVIAAPSMPLAQAPDAATDSLPAASEEPATPVEEPDPLDSAAPVPGEPSAIAEDAPIDHAEETVESGGEPVVPASDPDDVVEPDPHAALAMDDEWDALPEMAEVALEPAPPVAEDDFGPIVIDSRAVSDSDAALLRQLLDKLPIGILLSRDDVPIFMNRTLLDILGYADADAFHAERAIERLFSGAVPDRDLQEPVQVLTRSGAAIPVVVRLQMVPWGDLPASLMVFSTVGANDPVARIKLYEQELAEQHRHIVELGTILDTATDGVLVLDRSGRIITANHTAEALFGYEASDMAGESVLTLLAPESHGAARDYIDALNSHGVASLLNDGREVLGRVRQGGTIPLFMTMGRISDGSEPKFCAVLRDITAWKMAEKELLSSKQAAEQANAQKSDVLTKISHELRTPLSAIMGFAEVMMEERLGPVGNERYKEYLRDIHASGAHVLSLVNDLLDLAKIEAGKFDLEFGAVDANAVIAGSVNLIQPQAARAKVVVRVGLMPRLPQIVADERSLRQIILNLLSNAVKFTGVGGQVIVATTLNDDGEVVLRVRDTGIGMDDAEVAAALEPFKQTRAGRRAGGTGLGLPLTKALAEANRARFAIRSAPNSGTLVEVVFPTTRVLAS